MNVKIMNGPGIGVLYLHDGGEVPFGSPWVSVSAFDWNRDLSPWPASRVFAEGEDFAGGADAFLREITPYAAAMPHPAVIAGYSLAGLFALYACTRTDLFAGCACVSGSLWYPDFIPYLQKHPVRCRAVYFSLGEKEKMTRHPLMKTVEDRMAEAQRIVSAGAASVFVRQPGGHFREPDRRVREGIRWLRDVLD